MSEYGELAVDRARSAGATRPGGWVRARMNLSYDQHGCDVILYDHVIPVWLDGKRSVAVDARPVQRRRRRRHKAVVKLKTDGWVDRVNGIGGGARAAVQILEGTSGSHGAQPPGTRALAPQCFSGTAANFHQKAVSQALYHRPRRPHSRHAPKRQRNGYVDGRGCAGPCAQWEWKRLTTGGLRTRRHLSDAQSVPQPAQEKQKHAVLRLPIQSATLLPPARSIMPRPAPFHMRFI
ncbi:hypothetical protein WOLCODRAFT_162247 [Wolfiporia cocos MD-104 SS10]|uniref:Uncharacterized protein n=1 Tax=Wolfiporia cocos (strain MD-104) TaxID=742152 RepID=A0A2H3JDL4_WOLCO|nr:hypothetical protein WOLCODRAFT_162247 [Wolfiporia cocos MD-104 SS10]